MVQVKNRMFAYGLVAVLLFSNVGDMSLNGVWMTKWLWLLAAILFCVFQATRRQKHFEMSLALSYALLSGVVTAFYFQGLYKGQPFEIQSALRQSALMSTVVLGALAWHMNGISGTMALFYERALALGGVACSVFVIACAALGFDVTLRVPVLENPSTAGTFIVVTLFLVRYHLKNPWRQLGALALACVAVVLLKATTPLVALVAALLVAGASQERSWKAWAIRGVVVAGVLAFCLMSQPWATWASDSGRFAIWRMYIEWWATFTNEHWTAYVFGTGLGTTRVLLPLAQVAAGADVEKGPWFFWLHNDWLQLQIELGIVGMSFVMAFAFETFRRAWRSPSLLGAATAFAVSMLPNFSIHWPVLAFTGALLLRQIHKETG